MLQMTSRTELEIQWTSVTESIAGVMCHAHSCSQPEKTRKRLRGSFRRDGVTLVGRRRVVGPLTLSDSDPPEPPPISSSMSSAAAPSLGTSSSNGPSPLVAQGDWIKNLVHLAKTAELKYVSSFVVRGFIRLLRFCASP